MPARILATSRSSGTGARPKSEAASRHQGGENQLESVGSLGKVGVPHEFQSPAGVGSWRAESAAPGHLVGADDHPGPGWTPATRGIGIRRRPGQVGEVDLDVRLLAHQRLLSRHT